MRRLADKLDDCADFLDEIRSLPNNFRRAPRVAADAIYESFEIPARAKAAPAAAANASMRKAKGVAVGVGDVAILVGLLFILDLIFLGDRKESRGA